ncbi:hypothetical protein [Psychrobacillus sp. BL-248-WT-3]|uniref:PulJ/GspJ family protein n=1 Tax=Psychrobacillus sp. BL-248-WT-3 TaxID=2725306 RepID=UPI00146EA461|nr:hypothetical protein [Psychrobacillus sp. BL-248-WT-3]NME06160.1 hypothetical protein [Psychrobacillus sp. BL-248-WT-3]
MNKYIKNQNGLTLLELIASLILSVTIAILAFSLIFKGFEHYEHIQVVNNLRDEADFLMAELVKDIYTTKETDITQAPDKNKNIYYFLIKKTNNVKTKSGFDNGQLYISDKLIKIENKDIVISNNSYIHQNEPGLYEIHLALINQKNKKEISFLNHVRTINDKEEE